MASKRQEMTPAMSAAASAFGRLGGLKGGKARARKLSARRRRQIALKANAARQRKVGAKRRSEIAAKANKARRDKEAAA